jgi:tRNA/rRNA methyltransferase
MDGKKTGVIPLLHAIFDMECKGNLCDFSSIMSGKRRVYKVVTEITMAGTDKQRPLITEGPAIILVNPQLPENIGMVARAMANFGLAELRLVEPREEFPSEKARAAASKADHIIDNAVVYDDLPSALADLNFVYATTARERDGFKQVRSPVEANGELRRRFTAGEKTGIMFGRERFGLSNGEVGLADELVTFPVNPAFASLNIAQAVLLMSYEWMKSGLKSDTDTVFRGPEMEAAPKMELQSLFNHLEEALDIRGYFRPEAKKEIMVNNLRSVLTRAGFASAELKLLRGVITSLDVFTPKKPRGSGAPESRARKPATEDKAE